jgi:hypothetical protein
MIRNYKLFTNFVRIIELTLRDMDFDPNYYNDDTEHNMWLDYDRMENESDREDCIYNDDEDDDESDDDELMQYSIYSQPYSLSPQPTKEQLKQKALLNILYIAYVITLIIALILFAVLLND